MPNTRAGGSLVLSPAQADELVSPPRLEIVEALSALGRASVRDLAAHLGRSTGAVYHHLTALRRAGLVREVARRPGPRRPEAVFALAASTFAVGVGASARSAVQTTRVLQAVLRQASRDAQAAFTADPPALKGRFHGLQLTATLDPVEVRTILSLLLRVERIFRRANRRPRRNAAFRWTSLFLPIERRGG